MRRVTTVSAWTARPTRSAPRTGDALIHHCETIHHSVPNTSDYPRLGLLLVSKRPRGCGSHAPERLRPVPSLPRETTPRTHPPARHPPDSRKEPTPGFACREKSRRRSSFPASVRQLDMMTNQSWGKDMGRRGAIKPDLVSRAPLGDSCQAQRGAYSPDNAQSEGRPETADREHRGVESLLPIPFEGFSVRPCGWPSR
jgi:hypothetical protein